MIESADEYEKAQKDLRFLEDWLARLRGEFATNSKKGLTMAGVRKMIIRHHEELGEWEGNESIRLSAASAERAVAAVTR